MVREALENSARYYLTCPEASCSHGPLVDRAHSGLQLRHRAGRRVRAGPAAAGRHAGHEPAATTARRCATTSRSESRSTATVPRARRATRCSAARRWSGAATARSASCSPTTGARRKSCPRSPTGTGACCRRGVVETLARRRRGAEVPSRRARARWLWRPGGARRRRRRPPRASVRFELNDALVKGRVLPGVSVRVERPGGGAGLRPDRGRRTLEDPLPRAATR